MSFWTRKAPTYVDTGERKSYHATRGRVVGKTGIHPDLRDQTTSLVSHDWFFDKRIQAELKRFFWALPAYSSNAFDCENFSVELVQWVCRKAAIAGMDASPTVWVQCVKNKVPFAGVLDGNHALNLLETDKGEFAIEPQSISNRIIFAPLADYPNKAYEIYQ